ncbi:tRNA preQ1(34) S-adenosylmethionine ribosyltransferase-isomerase QueA [Parapedomonas caeni]
MRVDLFDFDLPEDRIALRPANPRDSARLLVVDPAAPANQQLGDGHIPDLLKHLRAGDVMVFNDTRVIPAQLFGRRGEARVGVTLHKRVTADSWWAFIRNSKRLKTDDRIGFAGDLSARVVEKLPDGQVLLRFAIAGGGDLMAALAVAGVMPLPPYIAARRPADDRDQADYQTVYGRTEGSVAAPTAGLHFTDRLLADIDALGVERLHVTLHVGAGTFLPVKAEDTDAHVMHAEWGTVTPAVAARINAAHARGGRVLCVGTTSLRLVESAAAPDGEVRPFTGETAIFITPGYRFRVADMLMTNFHLPRSTLFMLVSAFAGLDVMRAAYAHAIATGYRFYSYGDASLLHRAG